MQLGLDINLLAVTLNLPLQIDIYPSHVTLAVAILELKSVALLCHVYIMHLHEHYLSSVCFINFAVSKQGQSPHACSDGIWRSVVIVQLAPNLSSRWA